MAREGGEEDVRITGLMVAMVTIKLPRIRLFKQNTMTIEQQFDYLNNTTQVLLTAFDVTN